jgi:hypothetical protein
MLYARHAIVTNSTDQTGIEPALTELNMKHIHAGSAGLTPGQREVAFKMPVVSNTSVESHDMSRTKPSAFGRGGQWI